LVYAAVWKQAGIKGIGTVGEAIFQYQPTSLAVATIVQRE
jgi:hypothetical protein